MMKRQASAKLSVGEQRNQFLIRSGLAVVDGSLRIDPRLAPYARHFRGKLPPYEIVELAIEATPAFAELDIGGETVNFDTVLQAFHAGDEGNAITIEAVGDNDPLTKAFLDLGDEITNVDSVIEATTAGIAGNSITIAFVADGTGAGSFSRVVNALTFHFEDGVTTVANFEAAIAALAGADDIIAVKTAGTGANILTTVGDVLAATNLAGGTASEGVTVEIVGDAITIHFADGESTVADVEDALALEGSSLVLIQTAGTGANILTDADDSFGPTNLAGGVDEHSEDGQRVSSLKNADGAFTIYVEKAAFGGGAISWGAATEPVRVRWTMLLT
jgi:hypothetical protein